MRFNSIGKYSNIIQGLILLSTGLVLYYFIIPWQIPFTEAWVEMSSTFFPKIGAGLLVFLATLLTINNIRLLKKGSSYESIETNTTQRGNLLAGILTCFGYVFLMNFLGFLIATFLILIALMYLLGQRNLKIIIPIAVSFTALIYYVFSKVLNILLPEGFLSF